MLSRVMAVLASGMLVTQAPATLSLAGLVTGADGRPLAGAVVAVVPAQNPQGASQTTTSADGRFRLDAAPGKIGLTVTAPGCLPHFHNLQLVAGSSVPPLDVKLEKGGNRIEGRVIPAAGKSLDGLFLAFGKISDDEGDVFFPEVKDGRFAISLAPGNYFTLARAKAQIARTLQLSVTGDRKLFRIDLDPEPVSAGPEVRAWIRNNAIPLTTVEAGHGVADLGPLKRVVGSARVVALGEATHGTREFFQLKHRMLEFLAEEMGFTVFAIEANLPEAFAVNDYVLKGTGDPAQALSGLYFWTWNTEEVLDMIRWMRRYNEAPEHTRKLKFYGFDMQTPTVAYAQAKAYLDQVDTEGAATLERTLKELGAAKATGQGTTDRAMATAWKTDALALLKRIEARRADLVSLAGAEAYERQHENLQILAQSAAMQADPQGGYGVRDESMAANVRWIMEQEKGERIVLWAHNGHVSFNAGGTSPAHPMGWHLRQALGRDYFVFGFAFGEGGFQAIDYGPGKKGLIPFDVKPQDGLTLDAALASAGMPALALNLRSLPATGAAKAWFDSPQGTRSIGAVFSVEGQANYVEQEPPTAQYDALLFVNRTTPARPNPSGRRSGGGAAAAVAAARAPGNLGFEDGELGKVPAGWSAPASQDYGAHGSLEQPKEGARCLKVASKGKPGASAWYSVMQAVDATPYRGKKIRVTGWVRTDGQAVVKAGLWVRVDRPGGTGFFDNMMDRAISATTWTEAVIEGVVDSDARVLNFGCLVSGSGIAWFDGIRLDVLTQ